MRFGIYSLAGLVRNELGFDPSSGDVFVFFSRYKMDEMTPSIEVAKNISGFLNTTVGYLLGETDKADLFKDPVMLQRLSELDKMEATEKTHILHVLDGFIKSVKFKNIAAL